MTLRPDPLYPTSVAQYREVLDKLEEEAAKADTEVFHLWARLYHQVAGLCLAETGTELRPHASV